MRPVRPWVRVTWPGPSYSTTKRLVPAIMRLKAPAKPPDSCDVMRTLGSLTTNEPDSAMTRSGSAGARAPKIAGGT